MSTLGQRLRKARNLRGLKQAELAKASGVSQQLISRIENEKIDSTNEYFSLADVLHINAKWLATGKGEMEAVKRNQSDATEEEIYLLHLLRGLTEEQRFNFIASAEETKQQNEHIMATHLRRDKIEQN